MVFIFNDYEIQMGDIVLVTTYECKTVYGEVQDIYTWAFGGKCGIAMDIWTYDGDYVSVDDNEIQYLEYMGCSGSGEEVGNEDL